MERIASFCVDHTTLQRGMYLSRQDGEDLPAARAEAAAMLPVLEALTADQLHY